MKNKILFTLCLLLCGAIFCDASDNNQKTKIAFVINELSFRGVEVSSFDYAHFNETLLHNESLIINFDVNTDNEVRKKFTTRFPGKFFDCTSLEEMDYILEKEGVDILYYQKPGHNDGVISKVCKNAVHAVFPCIEPHGDVYAYISQWFVDQFPQFKLPFVPYIVRVENSDENLRHQLGIPPDALVFGRHGGAGSFNVPCAQEAVKEVAQARPDIYFLFLNTEEFCHLPNVIFLPKTTDMVYKAKFINSCDAMIHARWRGETFGLACAEFSIKNKPVITWTGPRERAHMLMLGDKALYYSTKQELMTILMDFKREPDKNWDAFSALYSPEQVMAQFDAVFIQPLIGSKKARPRTSQITFKPTSLHDGAINQDFMNQIKNIFKCDIVVSEGSELWQFIEHALALHKRPLIFFDCYWRTKLEQENRYVPSVIAELNRLGKPQLCNAVIVVDGISHLDDFSFESIYQLLTGQGYESWINGDALIAFKDPSIRVDQTIRAMTMSRLCEIEHFAQSKTMQQLLGCEHIIARTYCNASVDTAANTSHELPNSYGTRYLHLWRGLAYLHHKEYGKAAASFEHVLNCGYTHWRVYWYLGQARHQMGNIDCEQAMIQVVEKCPQFQGIIDFKKTINA